METTGRETTGGETTGRKTVGLVGCGGLGGIIAQGIVERLGEHYRLIGVCGSGPTSADELAARCSCPAMDSVEALIAARPDLLIEAAGVAPFKRFALDALRAGCDLMVLSVGAFADEAFYRSLRETAQAQGRKVHVPSGAIGGFDLMRSALWQGELRAGIENLKPPAGLEGAPHLEGKSLPRDREVPVFEGSAREAIAAFPKNVNVAVALASATAGVDNTRVEVRSLPELTLNTHIITLEGAFGRARLEIASTPSETASSSALAAYSVLARLENLASAIVF